MNVRGILCMGLLTIGTARADAPAPKPAAIEWAVEGQWMDTCSCGLPCPCWKSEVPTMGKGCQELYYFHVDKGHYGTVKLDGVDAIAVALSPDGKSMDQAIVDKDFKFANLYFSKALTPEVSSAAEKLFTEFTMLPLEAGKKHAVKRVEMKAHFGSDGVKVSIPKVLELDVKRTSKPYGADTKVTGFLGAGVEGVQERYDFSDDGQSWKLSKRNATFAPFTWSSKQAADAAAAAAAAAAKKK